MFRWTFVFFCLIISVLSLAESQPVITVNQVGYLPNSQKLAILNMDAMSFEVRNSNGTPVYSAELDEPIWWTHAGQWVAIADFSELAEPGRYYVTAEGIKSFEFEISESVYDQLCVGAIKYFYYSRASTAIDKKYGGKWTRKAGHSDDKVMIHSSAASKSRPEGMIISAAKGWYDAGDYNKYVVNSGITTSTLLSLYEAYPNFMKQLSLNIPESDNNVPDILDEALWNIQWLSTMQDPADGGVYHKLTTKGFDAFIMPEEATKKRYVIKKSTSAALNFTAVMAQASRVFAEYEKQLPDFSNKCLAKAVKAWQWAKDNPGIYYTTTQPEGITTGAYDDKRVKDEFCWASLELYITTGDEKYFKQSKINEVPIQSANWREVSSLGYISLLHNMDKLESLADTKAIKKRFLARAESLYIRYIDCGYRITNERFEWGSNSGCLNEAIYLLAAYKITGEDRYLKVAQAALGYILGRNPLNKSFVTGFGKDTPKNIHHRLSYADGIDEPIPGMLVGGPNHQDVWDCKPEKYPNLTRAALAYIDEKCSVSTNEVAINWNAALAYAVCAIKVETQKKQASISQVSDLPKISIKGNQFVKPDGQTIVFKGLALPDPVRLDAQGHWSAAYFDEMKAWNANLIRIPVSPRAWRDAGQDKIFELIDRAVLLSGQRGIYIVIDWHSNGNLKDELFEYPAGNTTIEETLDFWCKVAKRYKGENTIAFYEIYNEPTDFFGKLGDLTWDQWRDITKTIVKEIRKYDTQTIPIVSGLDWAYDLTAVKEKPFDIENVAYSIHPYPMKSKEPWEENWEKTWGFVADTYPMIALEFGYNLEGEEGAHIPTIGSEDFGKRIINYFSEKGISWTVWCFDWRWQPRLLADDSFKPTATQGTFFKNVLQNNITHFEVPQMGNKEKLSADVK